MFKLFKRNDEAEIRFCERCSSICDPACFMEESRDRAFEQLMRHGRWIV